MAWTLVQKTAAPVSSSTGSVAVTLPAGSTAGNLLACCLIANSNAAWSAPAGWVQGPDVSNGTVNQATIFYYLNNPGGISSAAFTNAGTVLKGEMGEFNPGAGMMAVLNASGTGTAGAVATCAAATTGAANAGDLAVCCFNEHSNANFTPAWTDPSGWSLLGDNTAATANALYSAYQLAAASGTLSVTATSSVASTVATGWAGVVATFTATGVPQAVRQALRRPALPPRRGHVTAVPSAAAAVPPPFPFAEARQWRQPRGMLPRRGRVTVTVRAQVNPPYPPAVTAQRRETWPRGVPRRGRETFAIPPQPDLITEVAQRRQEWPRGLPRRGRLAGTVPPQLNPPYPVAELRQQRQPRGFWPRRGHGFMPVPAQQAAVPAPAFVPQPPRRARLAALAASRRRSPVTVPVADVPASRQPRRVSRPPARRPGRLLAVPAAQELPPHRPRRPLRLSPGSRRGRVQAVMQQQATAPAPAFVPQRGPRRVIAVFWRRARQLMPWAPAPPPAFTVGTLTAATAPAATLGAADTATSALGASTAAGGGTLTASDQRTGGPG